VVYDAAQYRRSVLKFESYLNFVCCFAGQFEFCKVYLTVTDV